MNNQELSPERVVEILNEHKWRGREHWTTCMGSPYVWQKGHFHGGSTDDLRVEDARAIASYLELTREGGELERLRELRAISDVIRLITGARLMPDGSGHMTSVDAFVLSPQECMKVGEWLQLLVDGKGER